MPVPIRYLTDTGRTLAVAAERLSDGLLFDWSTSGFVASPATLTASLPEWTPTFPGVYRKTVSPTPVAAWPDGDYMAIVFDSTTNLPLDLLPFSMRNGDAYFPSPLAEVVDGQTVKTILAGLLAGYGSVPTAAIANGVKTVTWAAADDPNTPRVSQAQDSSGNATSVAIHPAS